MEWKKDGTVSVLSLPGFVHLYVGEDGGRWHWRFCRGMAIVASDVAATEDEAKERALAEAKERGYVD